MCAKLRARIDLDLQVQLQSIISKGQADESEGGDDGGLSEVGGGRVHSVGRVPWDGAIDLGFRREACLLASWLGFCS